MVSKKAGYDLFAISFNYGQRHKVELERAKTIAGHMEAKEHRIVNIDLGHFGGSALTDTIDVPTHRREKEMPSSIPVIYVPTRNTIFLS